MNIIKTLYNKIYIRLFLTKVIKHKYDTEVLPGYYIHLIEHYLAEEYKPNLNQKAEIIITFRLQRMDRNHLQERIRLGKTPKYTK